MSKGTKQKVTEAQKRATAKYNAKAYERIELRVIKGRKEIISKVAEANNESTNALINRAIDRELERLGAEPLPDKKVDDDCSAEKSFNDLLS